MESSNVVWSNQQGSRNRSAWALLVVDGTVSPWNGESITGVVAVTSSEFTRSGKWSHTTFRAQMRAGVRLVTGHDGWNSGSFAEGLQAALRLERPIVTWMDMANALGVSVQVAQEFLRSWRPKAAERIDEAEMALDAVDAASEDAGGDVETVTFSFGSPTRRQAREGFWTAPKSVPGYDGVTVELITADENPVVTSSQWTVENVRVVGAEGKVLSITRSSGTGGGYVSITVAVAR